MLIFMLYSLVIGASIGSFINVLIWRLPRGESIVKPRSHCTNCQRNIEWKYNIPILSWLYLSGKCKYCGLPISIRYLQVEFFTAILFIIGTHSEPSAYKYFSDLQLTLSSWFFISFLIPLTIIDFRYLWLPSTLTLSGKIIGFSNILVYAFTAYPFSKYIFIINHIISAISAYLFFLLIAYLGKLILKKKALGMGDVKLFSMIGLWLGFKGLLITIFLTFNLASIYSLIVFCTYNYKFGKVFPLGPFITFSSFLVWHFGNDMFLNAYYNLSSYLYTIA